MEIKVGKYTLKSDRYNYCIEETRKVDQTKVKRKRNTDDDETSGRVTGYFFNFEDLLEDFVERRLRESDAKDMEKCLREIASTHRAVKQIAKELPHLKKEPRKKKE